jgi:RimJ/RimL family protein N-acetyltransferase
MSFIEGLKSAVKTAPPEVSIRSLSAADARPFLKLIQRNRGAHLKSFGENYSDIQCICDALEMIASSEDALRTRRFAQLGIFFGDALVGILQIFPATKKFGESVEFGYWIDKSHEGLGITSRAVSEALGLLFKERGLDSAVIRCNASNGRSRSVAERLGFRFHSLLPGHRQFCDQHPDQLLFRLRRRDWIKQHQADLAS